MKNSYVLLLPPNRPNAFTLIEILVVISIIAILASLAFPAVGGAMDSAKKTTAKNAAVQIANAVYAYELEYGKLPTNFTRVDSSLMKILTGSDTTNNSRGIVFMEASEWKKGKGGTNANGYCDPWSSSNAFAIAIDAGTSDSSNYDNKVGVSTNGSASGSYMISKKAAVWSVNTTNKYQVRSWE
jgi:prepilin-type N-terminal cleavage/methylation domain-containing protein